MRLQYNNRWKRSTTRRPSGIRRASPEGISRLQRSTTENDRSYTKDVADILYKASVSLVHAISDEECARPILRASTSEVKCLHKGLAASPCPFPVVICEYRPRVVLKTHRHAVASASHFNVIVFFASNFVKSKLF